MSHPRHVRARIRKEAASRGIKYQTTRNLHVCVKTQEQNLACDQLQVAVAPYGGRVERLVPLAALVPTGLSVPAFLQGHIETSTVQFVVYGGHKRLLFTADLDQAGFAHYEATALNHLACRSSKLPHVIIPRACLHHHEAVPSYFNWFVRQATLGRQVPEPSHVNDRLMAGPHLSRHGSPSFLQGRGPWDEEEMLAFLVLPDSRVVLHQARMALHGFGICGEEFLRALLTMKIAHDVEQEHAVSFNKARSRILAFLKRTTFTGASIWDQNRLPFPVRTNLHQFAIGGFDDSGEALVSNRGPQDPRYRTWCVSHPTPQSLQHNS